MNGFDYDGEVIKERTGMRTKEFLLKLADFIDKKVTEKIISEDLNPLLPNDKFAAMRSILKRETVMLIKDEIKRLEQLTAVE